MSRSIHHARRALTGLAAAIAFAAGAAEPPPVAAPARGPDFTEARRLIANARRIVIPGGIERQQAVRIGGVDQWISIRGVDPRKPVLLVLHGGPGYPLNPTAWWNARGWEEYFTVVQWDQRGAGKSWLIDGRADILPTLTLERMVADAEEVAQWTRREFGQQRLFVLGHSWGSYLGLQLAARHPEWLHAYVGVGQLVDGPESERRGYRFALDAARRAGDAQAVRELEALAPYGTDGRAIPLASLYTQRKWVGRFGGVMAWQQDGEADSNLARLSPDYSDDERRGLWEGNDASAQALLPAVLALDLRAIRRLAVPVVLFEGRHDFNVNADVAAEWLAGLDAPRKRLVWFEHSGHMPMTEEPGKFLVELVTTVLPLAHGDGQP
jgi:proline iminopeptidase